MAAAIATAALGAASSPAAASASGAATVSDVSPNQGTTLGGTALTISGTGLTGATAVHLGGSLATSVAVVNDSTITATAPPGGAGEVDVTVTTGAGTSSTTTADHFTYVQPSAPTTEIADTHQFSLANSDGVHWQPLTCGGSTTCSAGTSSPLQVVLSPSADGVALVSANSDLWTALAGYNQDIGILVASGAGQPALMAWKESGGFAGTYSPNAAFVQATLPVTHGVSYTLTLGWKTNRAPSGIDRPTIYAGAGPINGSFSPTRLVATVFSPTELNGVTSTRQYTVTGGDGSSWQPMACTAPVSCSEAGTPSGTAGLTLAVTPAADSEAMLSVNTDLWTWTAGYDQDVGIFVNGALAAWKESGGFAGTFSPNAAFVQTVQHMAGGTTYTIDVRWKTNRASPAGTTSMISAGAGPIGAAFSATRLIALLVPAGSDVLSSRSTRQFSLAGSDGSTWQPMTCSGASTTCAGGGTGDAVSLSFTPSQTCTGTLTGNSDLWTAVAGYNQDVGIFVNGTLAAWKESGGFAGTFSPNAATVRSDYTFTAGTTYEVDLRWKANHAPGGGQATAIFAGAGPISGEFSPTSVTAALLACTAAGPTRGSLLYATTFDPNSFTQQVVGTSASLTAAAGPSLSCTVGSSGSKLIATVKNWSVTEPAATWTEYDVSLAQMSGGLVASDYFEGIGGNHRHLHIDFLKNQVTLRDPSYKNEGPLVSVPVNNGQSFHFVVIDTSPRYRVYVGGVLVIDYTDALAASTPGIPGLDCASAYSGTGSDRITNLSLYTVTGA